jgi:hypothetical protein
MDVEAKTIEVPLNTIDERQLSNVSIMPNGMTLEDFADNIAYSESLEQPPPGRCGMTIRPPSAPLTLNRSRFVPAHHPPLKARHDIPPLVCR